MPVLAGLYRFMSGPLVEFILRPSQNQSNHEKLTQIFATKKDTSENSQNESDPIKPNQTNFNVSMDDFVNKSG
jgi:hypothetical protein